MLCEGDHSVFVVGGCFLDSQSECGVLTQPFLNLRQGNLREFAGGWEAEAIANGGGQCFNLVSGKRREFGWLCDFRHLN